MFEPQHIRVLFQNFNNFLFQEMITEASGVLSRAGAGLGGVYFKQVTIVIPHHWDESHCRVKLVGPGRGVAYQVRSEKYCQVNDEIFST